MRHIDIHTFTGTKPTPTLVLVDTQREYLCEHRPLGLKSAPAAVENCKRLLAGARSAKIPVAFVRWQQENTTFSQTSRFSDWIDGLRPTASDMVFERQWPSCYASSEFADMMRNIGTGEVLIAGFTGSVACLSTIIDGIQHRQSFVYIEDASASHAHNGKSEHEVQLLASFFLSIFARVKTTEQALNEYALRPDSILPKKESYNVIG